MQQTSPSGLSKIMPLFLIIFIDSFGMGVIFPILGPLYLDHHSTLLPVNSTLSNREFWYGLTYGIFPFFMFFGAPILGDLSDTIGRKKVLAISLWGSFIGYVIAGIAVVLHMPLLLIFSRAIDGLSSGSVPVAQASIVDISTPENKASNLSLMLLMLSLGFVAGPAAGSLLANVNISHWFSYSTPLFVTACLAMLNLVLLQCRYQDTRELKRKASIKWHRSINIFISAFQHKKIKLLSLIFLTEQLGWSCYYTFIPLYLVRHYHFGVAHLGAFMVLIGLGFVIAMTFLMRILLKFLDITHIAWGGLVVTALGILLTIWPPIPLLPWLMTIPVAASAGITYTALITLFSNQVDKDAQGWVMGITGAVSGFAWTIIALSSGFIGKHPAATPLALGVCLHVLALGLMLSYVFSQKRNTPEKQTGVEAL